MKDSVLTFLVFFLLLNISLAQNESQGGIEKWLKKNEQFKPQFSTAVQLWSTYTTGYEIFNDNTDRYEPVDDRLNISLHRARLNMKGEPYPKLKYFVAFFYDRTGRDLLAGTFGPTNDERTIGIWDAFLHYRISEDESVNLVGGWFRPQMGRESITSPWSTTSLEKPWSQNFIRDHLVGLGPGRATGLNIGGLLGEEKLRLNYNLGVFNPLTTGLDGTSVGKKYSPLVAGRVSLSIGEPEMAKYGIGYKINYFSERNGVSLDLNFSTQGETDLFESAKAWGPSILANWGPVNFDAEWLWMEKRGSRTLENSTLHSFTTESGTGHARLGVNLPAGRYLIEPVVMVMHFSGEMDAEGQADATSVSAPSGEMTMWEAGVNWHLDGRNLRLQLFYTWFLGDAGAAGNGATINPYFVQGGVGAVHRGDWLGLGLNAIF